MDDISTYPFHWDDDNIILVPLTLILMTKPIIQAAKELTHQSFRHLNLKIQPGESGFKLGRIRHLVDAIESDVPLPPVILKPYHGHYEIIDGRHRVALSLAYGYTHIPAIIE